MHRTKLAVCDVDRGVGLHSSSVISTFGPEFGASSNLIATDYRQTLTFSIPHRSIYISPLVTENPSQLVSKRSFTSHVRQSFTSNLNKQLSFSPSTKAVGRHHPPLGKKEGRKTTNMPSQERTYQDLSGPYQLPNESVSPSLPLPKLPNLTPSFTAPQNTPV